MHLWSSKKVQDFEGRDVDLENMRLICLIEVPNVSTVEVLQDMMSKCDHTAISKEEMFSISSG